MKKLLFFVALICAMYCCPAFGQETSQAEYTIEEKFSWAIYAATDTFTKYSKTNLNVRSYPNTESEIYETLHINQEVEQVAEIEGWSCILYGDGFAYVKSEYLSDFPVRNRWNITLSADQIDLLERITMLEAGGESVLGQQAVVEVILNRMVNPQFCGTLEDVLSARGQFSSWKNRNIAVPTNEVKESVRAVLDGETHILPFSTVYFSRGAQNSRVQARIGGHVFCNE